MLIQIDQNPLQYIIEVRLFFWAEDKLAFYFQGMEGKGELSKNRLVRSGVCVRAQDEADVEEESITGVLFK